MFAHGFKHVSSKFKLRTDNMCHGSMRRSRMCQKQYLTSQILKNSGSLTRHWQLCYNNCGQVVIAEGKIKGCSSKNNSDFCLWVEKSHCIHKWHWVRFNYKSKCNVCSMYNCTKFAHFMNKSMAFWEHILE